MIVPHNMSFLGNNWTLRKQSIYTESGMLMEEESESKSFDYVP